MPNHPPRANVRASIRPPIEAAAVRRMGLTRPPADAVRHRAADCTGEVRLSAVAGSPISHSDKALHTVLWVCSACTASRTLPRLASKGA